MEKQAPWKYYHKDPQQLLMDMIETIQVMSSTWRKQARY